MAQKNMSLTKCPMPSLDPNYRNKVFEEVATGYTYEMAIELIKKGLAYVCELTPEEFKAKGEFVLHKGKIAEMATGEGKTLVATLAAYLNALEGKGVHIVTVNDYLAKRDAEWMGQVYRFLGLSVDYIIHEKNDMFTKSKL